ncbi:MAG: DUF4191 domain-containing protein, partial [Nocardioidaceae bacterium]
KQSRLKQFVGSYKMTRESDPRIGWMLLGAFVLVAAVAFAILYAVPGGGPLDIVVAVLFGILAALFLFARRAEKAAYAQIEGRPGAGAAALGTLRRGWKVQPAVAFNKSQDIVHRVVGPPGIVLIGEGNPNRLKTLLANERRKHERVASETQIHEVVVGEPPDGVPIPKLSKHVRKLGKSLKPADMTDVLARLKALDANRSAAPMPKGPVPTNLKGARGNLRGH